jgi:hypothetical protein
MKMGRATPAEVACFSQGVINVLKHLGMLAGPPQPGRLTHHLLGDGNLDRVISAPLAGFFRAEVALLAEVESGQRLGIIQDFFGQISAEIKAERAGVVVFLRRRPSVEAGSGLVQVTNRFTL